MAALGIASYIVVLVATALLARQSLLEHGLSHFMAALVAAITGYVLVAWVICNNFYPKPKLAASAEGNAASGRTSGLMRWANNAWIILAGALLLRIVPFASTPYLSDDYQRYLWEGHVQRHGFSPFAYAPNDPVLIALRNDCYEGVNHKQVSAVYPPLAQWTFRLTPGGVWGLKCVMLGADLLTLGLVLLLLRKCNKPLGLAAFYAFHPLVALEFAGSLHLDILAIAGLILAMVLSLGFKRRWLCALATAAATLFKPQAFVGVVFLFGGGRDRMKGSLRHELIASALPMGLILSLVIAAWLPFQFAGGYLMRGTANYAQNWEFNGLLFPMATQGLERLKNQFESVSAEGSLGQQMREFGYSIAPRIWARRALLLLFGALSVLALFKLRHQPLGCCAAILIFFLATTPTVHSWYAAWLVPFLPFLRSPAMTLFTALILLCHYVKAESLLTGIWLEPSWLGPSVWLAPCILGAYELVRLRSRGHRPLGLSAG